MTATRPGEGESNPVMAFLQARMGSTRLPGKVLKPIAGKSILERAIVRLQAVPEIDAVAVLTTCLPQDDCIAEEAHRLGVSAYRGPELDVLRRFEEASRKYRPAIIVRATADNPLIDIGSVSRIIHALRSRGLDYCMEENLPYGAATEVCTAQALAKSYRTAVDPRHREHVTLHIKDNPQDFRVAFLQAPENVRYPQVRVTVDTPDDLAFMEKLLSRLPGASERAALSDCIPFALGMIQERETKG